MSTTATNNGNPITCSEFEILLADAMDQTLAAVERERFEAHRDSCADCAELAADAMGAVAFIERAEVVQAPVALVQKIRAEITTGPSQYIARKSLGERILGRWFGAVLQPRLAMSFAMGVVSVALIGRVLVGVAGWTETPLTPERVFTSAENRVVRLWDRAMKQYDNSPVVTEMRAQLDYLDEDRLNQDSSR